MKGGLLDPQPYASTHDERESEGGGEGGAPAVGGAGRTCRSPSPDHCEEGERGEREAVDERGRKRFRGEATVGLSGSSRAHRWHGDHSTVPVEWWSNGLKVDSKGTNGVHTEPT